MTLTDFVANYIMHDSLIDQVEILDNGSTIVLWIDFAFWMQNGYNDADPETGTLKVIFNNVADYKIPENVNWDEVSILEAKMNGNHICFALINDMTDDYLEINIKAEQVSATAIDNSTND